MMRASIQEPPNNRAWPDEDIKRILDRYDKGGITQEELAQATGTSQVEIAYLETGRHRPSSRIRERIESKIGPVNWNQTEIEGQLKKKVKRIIRSKSKKGKKNIQVKTILYTVKKNDTLTKISARYLKNPYNWVGLYHTNGKKIKNPHKIYPGQKIFI